MGRITVDEVLARRFRIDPPPTLVARRHPRIGIAFSRMRSDHPVRGRSLAVPPEAAFSFHVPLATPFFSDLWMGGKRRTLPKATLGDAFLFDLHENPTVGLDTSFDSLRFYVPQAALDEMTAEAGIRHVKGLHARELSRRDPVMYGLAQTLAGAMVSPGDGSAMFCEHMGLAFFAYVIRAYGGVTIQRHLSRGGLAPWQLRRACEYMDSNLAADPSISEVAGACGLSGSHFSRAFKRETGFSPHRWLMKKRVERAKELLETGSLRLVDIAQICGFVDQSHFARVFSKSENCSPGRWRRLYLC